ncbi:hypothetical protein DIPPA_27065 [Diplonema papillatum]|nr:hypothetical protein DIPPA_27065 [Diplonema papillatum]
MPSLVPESFGGFEDLAQQLGLGGVVARDRQGRKGATVATVEPGSAAGKAGIAVGDRVLCANGQAATSDRELRAVLSTCEGGSLKLTHISAGSDSPTTLDLSSPSAPPCTQPWSSQSLIPDSFGGWYSTL